MKPIDEDVLARALQDLPIGGHAPISQIDERAKQLRRHRRVAGLAGAAVAIAAVAAAVLTDVGNRLDLGPADAPTPCPTSEADAPDIQWIPDRPPPEEVPDEMRLLWSESAAPAPTTVVAEDLSAVYEENSEYLAACGGPASVRLVETEGGVVTRFLSVTGGTQLPGHISPQDPDRTLDVGSTQIEIFEPSADPGLPSDLPLWPGYVSASWSRDGQDWRLDGGPVSDAELTELVELLEAGPGPGENIDLKDWSVRDGADFVFRSARGVDQSRLSYVVDDGEDPSLTVGDRPGLFWPLIVVGDRVVDLAGTPGLLSTAQYDSPTALYWQPSDDVYASLSGRGDVTSLVAIAQTIGPVPADDERVVDAWFTRTP
jgi:hypothetical protein